LINQRFQLHDKTQNAALILQIPYAQRCSVGQRDVKLALVHGASIILQRQATAKRRELHLRAVRFASAACDQPDPCLSLGAGAEYAAGTRLDALTGELARVVQETLQPERVSVWLRKK